MADHQDERHTTMKLQQLCNPLAIVGNGLNITVVADRLHTSQPGISKQLKTSRAMDINAKAETQQYADRLFTTLELPLRGCCRDSFPPSAVSPLQLLPNKFRRESLRTAQSTRPEIRYTGNPSLRCLPGILSLWPK